jgi:hypothetical protein
MNPKTGYTFKPEHLPAQHIDPTVVYIARHPFLVACMGNFNHNQVSDKTFEDKACTALEQHLQPRSIQRRTPDYNLEREGAWRILTGDKGGRHQVGRYLGKCRWSYFFL